MEATVRAQWIKLLGYMASSAWGCVREPKLYGPFRLVDSMSRIIEVLSANGEGDATLAELGKFIDGHKELVMTDEEGFRTFLNDLVVKIAAIIKAI